MGGGGFSMEDDQSLDRFFFGLAGKARPKVCFVGTASGDAASYLEKFYKAMALQSVEPTHLSLFKPPLGSIEDLVLAQDVIYVGGGNTRNLVALWKEWGLDLILKKAYEMGIVLGGISAGSICWFDEGVTDSVTGKLTKLDCLGFLPGSNCPHYDGEAERRPAYHALVSQGMKEGIACDDGVAGYFVNERLVEFVTSRPAGMAYRVSINSGRVIEEAVKPRSLV